MSQDLETKTNEQLKDIIRKYNLTHHIRGYSKMKKADLISSIRKHMKPVEQNINIEKKEIKPEPVDDIKDLKEIAKILELNITNGNNGIYKPKTKEQLKIEIDKKIKYIEDFISNYTNEKKRLINKYEKTKAIIYVKRLQKDLLHYTQLQSKYKNFIKYKVIN